MQASIRVMPGCYITGQAAGLAAAQALDTKRPVYDIEIASLQNTLAGQDVMIHFDDSLIPAEAGKCVQEDTGHV